ncbi:hypothetical protein GW17_00053221 [Ensete ventricosum]|nr:hypothetical protein GW17_00053221 [Ensete ventricosum]
MLNVYRGKKKMQEKKNKESAMLFPDFPRMIRRPEERGQPTMARPSVGEVGHDLATYKGAVGYDQDPLQRGDRLQPRPLHRGGSYRWARSLAARCPQERSARKGLPPAIRAAASRGSGAGLRRGYPLARRLSTDKGSRRLCRD